MNIRVAASQASWLLVAALAAGCDSTSDRSSVPPPAASAAGTPAVSASPVVSYGTVTGLGSVWVNGVHYDTTDGEIDVDDRTATQHDLHVGDVVRVTGGLLSDLYTGVAGSVEVKHALHGPVSSVDVRSAALVVLGQTVLIDAAVVFDDSVPQRSLAGLAVGDVVEVAGLPGREGMIAASRIALKPLGPLGLKVTGTARSVDRERLRFTVNGLVVDFRGLPLTGLSHGSVFDGDRVEVLGSSLSANGELVATVIRPDDPRGDGDVAGKRIHLEGVVTAEDRVSSPASFMLHGVRVTTQSTTQYGGPKLSSWLDAKVAVQGVVRPDKSVLASVVRFRRPAPIELRARVDSVNPATNSFVVLGITIETAPFARIADESAIHAQPFGLSALAPGDFVHVVGAEAPAGSRIVVASLVERTDAQEETQLQGYPERSPYGSLIILGVNVTTTGATQYPTPNGGNLSSATFFFDLEPTSLIDVRGAEVADREVVASEARYADWTL